MRACNCARASPLQSRTRVGCDSMRNTFDIVSSQFQSTHPRGVRLNGKPSAREVKMVSIHAPAWGATPQGGAGEAAGPCFNPRTRVGCDSIAACATWPRQGFNPRTRVGCDPWCWRLLPFRGCFNPRTRVGCDAGRSRSGWWPCSFNPRTRVGCDLNREPVSMRVPGFNPRTRVGCDPLMVSFRPPGSVFQSTHPRGVRHRPWHSR